MKTMKTFHLGRPSAGVAIGVEDPAGITPGVLPQALIPP